MKRRIKILPGVRVNLGKKGVSSVSVGGKIARVNISKAGTRTTVREPKTGLSYSKFQSNKESYLRKKQKIEFSNREIEEKNLKTNLMLFVLILIVFILLLIWINS